MSRENQRVCKSQSGMIYGGKDFIITETYSAPLTGAQRRRTLR